MDEAYRVLEDGLTRGFFPGKLTYFILANALWKAQRLDKMCQLIDASIVRHRAPGVRICRKFIFALCKAGRVDDAYLLPSKIKRNDMSVDYRTLIYDLCNARRGEMASKLLLEMQKYGYSLSCNISKTVINVLCETGRADQVLPLLDMHVMSLSPDTNLYNAFIQGLCYAGRPEIATRAYEKMIENKRAPNSISHLSLLTGYLRCKKVVDALKFFEAILASHPPSTRLYNVFVRGLSAAGNAELALMFFEEMSGKGFVPSLLCYEEVIHILCTGDKFNLALKIFGDMEMKGRHASVFIYTVLLQHCFKVQDLNQALVLFEGMCKQKPPGGISVFSLFVDGLSKAWRLEFTLGLLEEVIKQSFGGSIVAYNILLKGLCKEGKMQLACDLFRRMSMEGRIPNEWSYDILAHGFCKVGNTIEAQKIMEEMIERGFNPSRWTCSLFKALINRGMNVVR